MAANFKKKKDWANRLESRPVLAVLCIILLFFAWSVYGMLIKMIDTSHNKKIAEDKIVELTKNKEKLSQDINMLNTDKGQEEVIREKFGLAKEGEGAVVIVDDKSSAAAAVKPDSGGFFSFFTGWFK